MSRKIATLVYSKRVGGAHRKAVLAYMADRANDDGTGVYCSKGTIAEETEVARSTVFKIISELVSEGIIREVGQRPCRNGFTVIYDMSVGAIEAFPDVTEKDNTSPTDGPVRGVTSPPAGPHQSASRTPTSPPAGPKPSLEPSMNQEPPLVPPPISEPPEPKARLPSEWALSDEGWAYARSQHIPDEVIHDEARGFHAYWSDRRDRDARKSARGWEQCWAGWCRRIASRYRARGGVAGQAASNGYGQGGSIASIAARRRASGQV